MAVSRATKATATNSTASNSGIPGAPRRVSFAKIREPLGTPNLLDLQIQSFEWFTGAESWFQRRIDAGEHHVVRFPHRLLDVRGLLIRAVAGVAEAKDDVADGGEHEEAEDLSLIHI